MLPPTHTCIINKIYLIKDIRCRIRKGIWECVTACVVEFILLKPLIKFVTK